MNIYSITAVKIQELFNSAFEFFGKKFQLDRRNFSMSSAWGQLLNAMHELTRLNLFYVEDAVTELNVSTALRESSIRGLSTLTGHVPFLGNTANGTIIISKRPNSVDLNTANVIIPNNTTLYNRNTGLEYFIALDQDYIILTNDNIEPVELKIKQGRVESQTVTGTGEMLQTFNFTSKDYFDYDEIDVYVNDEKWSRVNSLFEMSYQSKEYYVNSSITGGITIFFGNELSGAVPELGSIIRVQYIRHNGESGNLMNNARFEFIDPITDTIGNEVDFLQTFSISVKNDIMFGSNPEPIELTRRLMNRVDRSNILYTADSFEVFLKRFNLFSTVHAYKKTGDNIIQDDNIVYILLIPDIQKRIKKSLNYYRVPLDYFKITSDEKNRIRKMIEASGRKPSQIEISITDPVIRKYVINIDVILHPEFSTQREIVKNNIKESIANYFLYNERFDRIPRSDLIRVLENVPGIDSVSVTLICERNEQNKKNNPGTTELIGIDSFNDIILKENEVAVLRGGWSDASGVHYTDDPNADISMINISFR